MRILFYEDPVTDQNAFLWRAPHVIKDTAWMAALTAAGCELRMLINSAMLPVADAAGTLRDKLIIVPEGAIIAALPSPQLNINTLFQRWSKELNGESQICAVMSGVSELYLALDAKNALANTLAPYVGNFQPDIIITWVPVPHLRKLFPDALILHKETSLLSRPPFPLSYYLDPGGFGCNALMGRGCSIRATTDVIDHHKRLHAILDKAMSIDEDIWDLVPSLSDFDATVLVAGHTNNVFLFDGACSYRSQVHLIIDVLDRAPSSWGIIATEHPDCTRLTDAEIGYLKAQYPNFAHWPELRNRPGASQSLVRHVDAVAAVSSSVGLQAVLWGKRLYAFGRSQLNRFDQGAPLDASSPQPKSLVGAEAAPWLCFHYSYQDAQMTAPRWLADHLGTKLHHWRTKGLHGYFDTPIREPAEMLTAYEEEVVTKSRASTSAVRAEIWKPHHIDMANGRHFAAGWGRPEGDPTNPYRWTTSRNADLRVLIDRSYDWTISLIVGSLTFEEPQTASLLIGEVELSSVMINAAAHVELTASIPHSLVGDLGTTITLRAAKIARPEWESRDLALGVSRIVLQANPRTVESINLFQTEPQ